ncbi:MAG TPA: M1 family metallopeptidase [Longimicrobiales bacterium]|nr:M1 family metallopeptidase [Longimicrobiales bacterium]
MPKRSVRPAAGRPGRAAAAGALSLVLLLAAAAPLRAQLWAPRPRDHGRPGAGPTRLPDGRPGPAYWQQRVDYRADATLQPDRHRLVGTEWITYHNASPDTLRELYWHLYQNIFLPRDDGRRHARLLGVAGAEPEPTRGMTVRRVEADGRELAREVDRTLMRTPLGAPLPPGAELNLRVDWTYEVPAGVALRTGRIGADYGMAQWYPQIAVYDDERGWDSTPYLGQGEFYLEYGDWDVRLRLPADYVVAATGTLENAADVLTPEESARFAAARADTTIAVVAPGESLAERPRRRRAAWRVWHFRASRVRDFAWAASPRFLWDVTRTGPLPDHPDGLLVQAFYRPEERASWGGAAATARDVMERYSAQVGPYVYPQVSVVAGPVTGMEYPMLVFGNAGSPVLNEPARVLTHELGHQWFPMMVGSNEGRFAVLDEGVVTFLTAGALDTRYGDAALLNPRLPRWARAAAPPASERLLDQTVYLLAARAGREIPILTPADEVPEELYGVAAYMKPGSVLFMLRDLLGADVFDRAVRAYAERWRFRHPYPDDFFDTVEDVAGRDLDWFWGEWFRETWTLDLALDDVRQQRQAGRWSAELDLRSRGRAVMPATVRLWLDDGSTRDVRVPETVWTEADAYTLALDSLPAPVHRAEIDPGLALADVDRLNNRWPRPRISVDWRPNLFADLLPPLDAYRVALLPSAWYTRAADAELGLSAVGSYLGADHRIAAMARIGTGNGRVDGRLAFGSPLRGWGIDGSWAAEAFRLEGRIGGGLGVALAPGDWNGLLTSHRASTRLRVGVDAIRLQDSAYVPTGSDWARGTLVRLSGSIERDVHVGAGALDGRASTEAGGPGSDWSYGKGLVDLRAAAPLGGAVRLDVRAVGGYASGNVPPQTAFYLAEPSPLERFRSPLFRSAGVLDALGLATAARLGGGGAVAGADLERHGSRLAAANLAVGWHLLELFGDIGDAWSAPDAARWTADAGVGAGLELPLGQGPVELGRWSLHVRAPFWVDDPRHPADSGWRARWRVILGARWGD